MNLPIYNIGIFFYGLISRLITPFNAKAKQFVSGRKGLLDKISLDFNDNNNQIIWFHCASLGEFEQGIPVIEAFKKEFSTHKILLTFFSPSGYELRKNYTGADFIYYLPLDSKSNAQRFLEITRPSMVIFVKYSVIWLSLHLKVKYLKTLVHTRLSTLKQKINLFIIIRIIFEMRFCLMRRVYFCV